MDCILTCGFGYKRAVVEPFLRTLREHYRGQLIVFTDNPGLPGAVVCKCDDPQIDRYGLYLPVVEAMKPRVKRVLLTDMRDVLFQADPFSMPSGADLEFYLEANRIRDCRTNSKWVRDLFGEEGLQKVQGNWISCAGTTRGSREAVLHYLRKMVETWRTLRPHMTERGFDQGIHNMLLRSGAFDHLSTSEQMSGEGAVRSLSYDTSFPITREGKILNTDGAVTPVVHHYTELPRHVARMFLAGAGIQT